MPEERSCQQCGQKVPADAPGGLCPACLLRVGLASQSQEPRDGSSEVNEPTASYRSDEATTTQNSAPLAPGQQYGGYRIVTRLGSGGMGTVYEADHLESGRRVALKVLGHRLDSANARQRFLREGRLAASVNHPNSVYVFGTEEVDGVPVISMELVPGGTLEGRVRQQGPLPVGEAVDSILQVIDGLEAAERCGVLHRDVKPANCFVDRSGLVKVGDYGLSISTSLRAESNVTNEGTFLGTPAFSSPEQLRGDELDVRSDIYAVGVTLYYLLTGEMPFHAENLIRLIATVLEQPVKGPATLRSEIPRGLNQAVVRCLQKQPTARFRNYDDLRSALAPYGTAAPTPASLGLRASAGLIDHFLWSLIVGGGFLALGGDYLQMSRPEFFGSVPHLILTLATFSIMLAYFTLSEGYWGASVGKAICRIRVVNSNRNPPGFLRALARAAVYFLFPQTVGLVLIGLIATGVMSLDSMWLVNIVGYSPFVLLIVMFSTARRANGYAGFQDLLSGTQVVLRSVRQSRPGLSVEHAVPAELESTPTVGPYHVLGTLRKVEDSELLLGYDARLLRKVWIRRLPDGTPPVTATTRDLSRPGRLRWLAGQRAPGDCWDAYEALSGDAFPDVIKTPRPWSSVRFWLADLLDELAAAEEAQTLPDTLSLSRIWITAEGRAKLLDFPVLDSTASDAVDASNTPEADWIGAFCNAVTISSLKGRVVRLQEARAATVAVPLPLSARALSEELPQAKSAAGILERLRPLLQKPTEIRRVRRLAPVGVCCVLMLAFGAMLSLGFSMTQTWVKRYPQTVPLFYCTLQIEKLERDGGASDELHDLEIYVAGHFGPIIRDREFWANPYVNGLFKRPQRQRIEGIVKEHPSPGEEEVANAAASLRSFLDELPRELPGMPDSPQMRMLFVFAMALGNILFLIVFPGLVAALLFRTGLLQYVLGIVLVTRSGARASRLRVFWRAILLWSPFLLLPLLLIVFASCGIPIGWSVGSAIFATAVAIGWSLSMPHRGIPDRLAGTYPVLR